MGYLIKIIILLLLIKASLEDIKKHEVSNIYSLFFIILGSMLNKISYEIIFDLIIIITPFIIIKLINDDYIGMGDIKILGSLTFIYKYKFLLNAIILSILIIIIYSKIKKIKNVPFIPFITISIIIFEIINLII